LTGYLWQYISKYAAIIKPLQLQKTFLNQGLKVKETKGNARKHQAITIRLNEPTLKELNFHHLQTLFFWSTMLVFLINNVGTFFVKTSTVCWSECIQEVWVWGSCLSCKEAKRTKPHNRSLWNQFFSKSATHRRWDTLLVNET
jgi:hypothetical protein